MDLQISHSMRSAYKACTRKVFYKYVAGVIPRADNNARVIGRAFHEALDLWRQGNELDHSIIVGTEKLINEMSLIESDKEKIIDKSVELKAYLLGYSHFFGDEAKKGYLPEQQLIFGDEIGYVDAIYFDDDDKDKVWFIEDKTASALSEDLSKALLFNDQIVAYCSLLQANGYKVGGCCYRQTLKTKTKRGKKETAQDYAERILDIYNKNYAEKYREIKVTIPQSVIDDFQVGRLLVNTSILNNLKLPREPKYWPRNTDNCLGVYGKCDYFKACTGCEDPLQYFQCRDKEPLDGGEFIKKFFV